MSILALLAAAAAKVFKPDPPETAEIAALKAKVDDLNRQVDDVLLQAERYYALARRWEERYQEAINPALRQELTARAIANQQAVQLLQAHANLQSAQLQDQQFHNAQQFYNQQSLGAQNLPQGFDQFCNCVPARHDLLMPRS